MLNAMLWNLLLTAGLAVVLFSLCRLPWLHRRPALRCWLWLLLFVKLVTPSLIDVPLLPAEVRVASHQESTVAATDTQPIAEAEKTVEQQDATLEIKAPYYPGVAETMLPGADAIEAETPLDTSDAIVSPEVETVPPEVSDDTEAAFQVPYLAIFLGLSLTGTCAFLVVYGLGAVRLHRWLQRAGREDPNLTAACEEVASILKIRKAVRSCVVETRTTPLLWTWGRPTVAVPRQLLDEIEPGQLQQIVAHELAHLLRRDHWINLFAFLVKILLWWNPIVWWADREMCVAQELCCDAIAIDCCRANRQGYATTLLQALEFIQAEPCESHPLALGMGSKKSILRRFEMIGETRLTYRLSRWTFLALLVLAVPLVCMPVRGQEKAAEASPAVTAVSGTAVSEKEKPEKETKTTGTEAEVADAKSDDNAKLLAIGEAVRKRITTYSDEATLTLKDGETGRMRVKKNLTPVAEILVTAHLVNKGGASAKVGSPGATMTGGSNADSGTQFELVGVDAEGKVISEMKTTSPVIPDDQDLRMGFGHNFIVDHKPILSKIQLTPKRSDDQKSVTVTIKSLFTESPTPEEYGALHLLEGKDKKFEWDTVLLFQAIFRHIHAAGQYPKSLEALGEKLPKDVYSPRGEDYHYVIEKNRIIISSCGEDGIYDNADDAIFVYSRGRTKTGLRHKLYPLEEKVDGGKETVSSKRPDGTCSLCGKVISTKTGKPVANATLRLTHLRSGSIVIDTAEDGTFAFEKIATGPYLLSTYLVPGYHNYSYNPEKNTELTFSLKKGEQREGLVFKLKTAYCISGKVVDEEGNVPKQEGNNVITAMAWYEKEGSKQPEMRQGRVSPTDGSYQIGYLKGKPVYVSIVQLDISGRGDVYQPIHYPGTFFREDAKQVTFEKGRSIKNINVTLKKKGGLAVEGTVRDEQGKPVPETLIVVRGLGMVLRTYTDEQGKYRLECLDSGETMLHVDAVHCGLVAARKKITLDRKHRTTTHDFTLSKGVSISGKLVDEAGKPWKLGYNPTNAIVWSMGTGKPYNTRSEGHACLVEESTDASEKSPWMSGNGNRYNRLSFPIREAFGHGTEKHPFGMMFFPTETMFRIPSMTPGRTKINFSPNKEGQVVKKILYQGKDVTTSGFETRPGEEVKDVKIVIGKGQPKEPSDGEKPTLRLWTTGDVTMTVNSTYTATVNGTYTAGKKEEKKKKVKPQKEKVLGERPHGDCSIRGKVVSAETGKPIKDAKVFLFQVEGTQVEGTGNSIVGNSIVIRMADDGTFHFKNISQGSYLLQTSCKSYQNGCYNPKGEPGHFASFRLKPSESRTGIVFKLKKAYTISGKVLDEHGDVPKYADTLRVSVFSQKDRHLRNTSAQVNLKDGSYRINGLSNEPVYVVTNNTKAARKGNGYPPIYYPSTFFRDKAKSITFEKERNVKNIDISLKKEGGLVLKGTVLDENGKPVPETFIVAHPGDRLFCFVADYTDKQGKYRLDCLEDVKYTVHADATHRGFVRKLMSTDLDRKKPRQRLDFTLKQGATISGKIVDEKGNAWQISKTRNAFPKSYGSISVIGDKNIWAAFTPKYTFCLSGFWSKHRSPGRLNGFGSGMLSNLNGNYLVEQMTFPSKNTFTVMGMMPAGKVTINFNPRSQGEKVVKILYNGKDVMNSGFEIKAGQEVKDVTIVIGKDKNGASPTKETESVVVKGRNFTMNMKGTVFTKTTVTKTTVTKTTVTKTEKKNLRKTNKPVKPQKKTTSGIKTQPGKKIEGLTIVIGKKSATVSEDKEVIKQRSAPPMGRNKQPRGNCSLHGKVVSVETGKPIGDAWVYLYNMDMETTGPCIPTFMQTASDGTFHFKKVPQGPLALHTSNVPGYQDTSYNPEGITAKHFPVPDFSQFSLKKNEQRSGIVLKAKRAFSISGKVRDENGNVPKNMSSVNILSIIKDKEHAGEYRRKSAKINRTDGSYKIDGLHGEPTYVMAVDCKASQKEAAFPPTYHPNTFFQDEAKLIIFDKKYSVDHVDITLKKEGGLTLEGTVRDKSGKPVPEALIVVHRHEILFDFLTAYTDKQGKYKIQGLGDGKLLAHVDAMHRGFVKRHIPIELDRKNTKKQLDITLNRGVTISGKFVDEEGNDWETDSSYGHTNTIMPPSFEEKDFEYRSLAISGFGNKYNSHATGKSISSSFNLTDEIGNYNSGRMQFPTKNTFLIYGIKSGDVKIDFYPEKEGQVVKKILYQGKDVKDSLIRTKPGKEIKDVTIVIGKEE